MTKDLYVVMSSEGHLFGTHKTHGYAEAHADSLALQGHSRPLVVRYVPAPAAPSRVAGPWVSDSYGGYERQLSVGACAHATAACRWSSAFSFGEAASVVAAKSAVDAVLLAEGFVLE